MAGFLYLCKCSKKVCFRQIYFVLSSCFPAAFLFILPCGPYRRASYLSVATVLIDAPLTLSALPVPMRSVAGGLSKSAQIH